MGHIYLIGFIEEDRERIAHLKQVIEEFGWQVDWDRLAPTKKNWSEVLMPRIESAPCVLVVWTSRSVKNRWTSVEADVAQESRQLVSVLLDDVDLPRAFRGMESVDLIRWQGDIQCPEMDLLATQLSAILGPRPDPSSRSKNGAPKILKIELERPRILTETQPQTETPPQSLVLVKGGAQPASLPAQGQGAGTMHIGGSAVLSGFDEAADYSSDGDRDLAGELAFFPSMYGWSVAWALGLSAIGLYVRSGLDLNSTAVIYLGNHLYSALTGAAVGIIGAAFMLYALRRQGVGLSLIQMVLILLGWGAGGALGLEVSTTLNLPVVGVASGIVGFEVGWVICWIIGGSVGGGCTWIVLRRSSPFLSLKDLALTAGGFSAGALIGWIGSWILLALPVMLVSWVIGKVITEGSAPMVGEVMTQLMSLALTGAGGGAMFGLAGGLLLFGTLTRAESEARD